MEAQALISKTHWACEICLRTGSVEHAIDADVYTVVYQVEEAHGLGGGCAQPISRVRVSKNPIKFNVAKNRWE